MAVSTPSAAYQDCTFDRTRLDKVSFGGSLIERCRFSGLLSEVEFCRTPWDRDRYRPNPMDDVDFSKAELFHVGFAVAVRAMSPRQRVGTVHRRELEPLADEVIAPMRGLEGECR